jgi:hypothetical protein
VCIKICFNAFTQHHPRHAIDAPKVPEKEVQSELVRQATLILRRDKEQRQAMKAVATELTAAEGENAQLRRGRRQDQHKLGQMEGLFDAQNQRLAELERENSEVKAAQRREQSAGRENARQVKDHRAAEGRWENERQRAAKRAKNAQQQVQAQFESEKQQRLQLEAMAKVRASEACAEAIDRDRIEQVLREESSRKDKELTRKAKALEAQKETVRILGESARANAHAVRMLPALYQAERKAERSEQVAAEAVQRAEQVEAEGKRMGEDWKKDRELLRAVLGDKRTGLTKRESEVRSIAKQYWTNSKRRDKQQETEVSTVLVYTYQGMLVV